MSHNNTTRREFLRSLLRYCAAGLLATGTGVLLARRKDACTRNGLCHGCPALTDCGLPSALSAKQHTTRKATR